MRVSQPISNSKTQSVEKLLDAPKLPPVPTQWQKLRNQIALFKEKTLELASKCRRFFSPLKLAFAAVGGTGLFFGLAPYFLNYKNAQFAASLGMNPEDFKSLGVMPTNPPLDRTYLEMYRLLPMTPTFDSMMNFQIQNGYFNPGLYYDLTQRSHAKPLSGKEVRQWYHYSLASLDETYTRLKGTFPDGNCLSSTMAISNARHDARIQARKLGSFFEKLGAETFDLFRYWRKDGPTSGDILRKYGTKEEGISKEELCTQILQGAKKTNAKINSIYTS